MRLDRRLSVALGLSRKAARDAVRRGVSTPDGRLLLDPGAEVGDDEPLVLDGADVPGVGPLYLVLHKPAGYVCARGESRSVLALLPPAFAARVEPVGRLDADTTGLLLLTDDGGWGHRIASPKAGCAKRYVATLAEPLAAGPVAALAAGVDLHGEREPAFAQASITGEREATLVVHEGRYHLVKRLIAAVGNRVIALHRDRVGALDLDLAVGQWRVLDPAEVAALAAPTARG